MQEIVNQSKVTTVHQNAVIIANIIELTVSCLKRVAVSEVSDALGEDSLNRDVVSHIVANRIKDRLIA